MSNDKKIKDKYEEYYREGDIGKQRIIKEIDDIQTTNDEFDYNFYPGSNDEDFIFNISRRLEFFHLKSLFNITELSKKCPTEDTKQNDPFNFELTNNQQFLKNFMSNKTPYKGLVIFHGVGVGKTCSAINISRSYREIFYKNNKKIICLVPKNIRGGWENTIYDPSKGTQQCSGDSFEDIIIKDKKGNVSKRDVKNLIREYYDFYGYLAFANSVEKLIKNEVGNRNLSPLEREEIEKRIIDKNFSHRVLIIDEIHNLREENEIKGRDKKFRKGDEVFNQEKGINVFIVKKVGEGEYTVRDNDNMEENVSENILNHIQVDRKSKDIIEKVIRYSRGMKIILLSATPMFNRSSEIIWLLNLLLKNDNRPTIKKDDVFDGDKITEAGIKILKNKTTGYFSYLRGENPISFPIRFYPDINSDKRCIGGDYTTKGKKVDYLQYPKYTLFTRERIDNSVDGFRFMKMYGSIMQSHQKKIYEEFIDRISRKEKNTINLSDRNIGTQLSNVVYYNGEDSYDFKDNFGQRGFEKIFDLRISRKSKKCRYNDEGDQILSYDNIKSYSTKIHTILENMLKHKTEGIIFIYSDYIFSGILPMAIALEHIGFEKYNGENILETSERITPIGYNLESITKENNKKAKYIVLTGDKSLSPNNEKERKDSLNYNNLNGENIKVILGNSVTSEGMDFKNIREIHVLDPWYHLYKIEQIIGRGIRYCSHSYHPKEKQNVTVYLHTSLIDYERESIDTDTYRIAEKKASEIGEIEKILKGNAIDAYINKDINYIHGLKNVSMTTTWGKFVDVDINDKEYTKICSFSDDCKININIEKYKKLENHENIIDDTFSIDDISGNIEQIYSIVKELFEIYEIYSMDELNNRIKEVIDTDNRIIKHALDEICDDKKVVWNKYDIPGYIINKNDVFLFQPDKINDEFVPFYYRSYEGTNNDYNYNDIFSSIKVDFKDSFHCESSYNGVYENIKNLYNNKLDKDMETYGRIIDGLDSKHLKHHYIDSLTYDEKLVLLKEILCGFISSGEKKIQDKYDKEIFDFFINNLIYFHDDQYYGFEKRGKVVGFFLCNPNKYNKIQDIFNNFDYYEYDGEWKHLDEVGISILKNNILRNKRLKTIFKTGKVWGYSFKEDKKKHVFKIVDEKYKVYDNEPGKVIGDKGFPMLSLLQEYMNNFDKNNTKYIELMKETLEKKLTKKKWKTIEKDVDSLEEEGDIVSIMKYLYKELRGVGKQEIITKEFITKMYELSSRNILKFINYDTFLFKFAKSL
tara:strand:+ start:2837 stop:6619 length:3783 start_codon:yes stop_codon:yes gene_type:complete